MKLTNTKTNKSNKGMTLIELTVVILVLLSLISVLFVGARAWMKGSDRANAALLIRNAQQGVRSHGNIMGVEAGGSITGLQAEVFGPGKYVETANAGDLPAHPGNETGQGFQVTAADTVPAINTLYMTSQVDGTFYDPTGLQ